MTTLIGQGAGSAVIIGLNYLLLCLIIDKKIYGTGFGIIFSFTGMTQIIFEKHTKLYHKISNFIDENWRKNNEINNECI